MEDVLKSLRGRKTYLAGTGLAGLALWHWSTGDVPGAVNNALQALVAFGLRDAISRILPTPPVAAPVDPPQSPQTPPA